MEGFSFRDLVKPGAGAAQAIKSHLELGRHKELRQPVPAGWYYAGPSGLLLSHGRPFEGAVTPEPYRHLIGTPTLCHNNTLAACQADPTLRFFTGYYTVGRMMCQHSWAMMPDDTVVELTYPTFGVHPDARMADTPEDGPSELGWMPPQFWAYFGLEFKVPFIEALIERYGLYWPLLEPGNPFYSSFMATPYTPDGFTVTPTP